MKLTFIDANVLLETLIPGRKYLDQAKTALAEGQGQTAISPLSVHLFVYFGRKEGFPLDDLLSIAKEHWITSFGSEQVEWAVRNRQDNDFEDALQVACAVLHGCTSFVTFDGPLAENYGRFIDIRLLGKSGKRTAG